MKLSKNSEKKSIGRCQPMIIHQQNFKITFCLFYCTEIVLAASVCVSVDTNNSYSRSFGNKRLVIKKICKGKFFCQFTILLFL